MAYRVGLDLSAVPARPAGAGRYCVELAKQLDAHDIVSLTAITRRNDQDRWGGMLPHSDRLAIVPNSRPMRLLYEQLRLGSRADRMGLDVYHGPHYSLPARLSIPMVATIHDLTFFDHPEVHEQSKVLYFRGAIKHAANHAAGVICDSERTARRLSELFDVAGDVTVAELGIDHGRFAPSQDHEQDARLLHGVGVDLERPLMVCVGTLEPRKGLTTLLDAFEALALHHKTVELVMAGQRGWNLGEFDARLAASPSRERIRVLGYVEDPVIPALYRRATAVIYPSIDEGFGLPVVEALACGAMVITTQDSVMADLAGSAACYVPARDTEALSQAMRDALDLGSQQRADIAHDAQERAQRYTWARCAEATMGAYAKAMATNS